MSPSHLSIICYLIIALSGVLKSFRSLHHQTYMSYREGLSRTMAMMVRYFYLRKKPQKAKRLGKFTLPCTESQEKAAQDLRALFVRSEGAPDAHELQISLHRLFDSQMRSAPSSLEKIASPGEVAICITCMEDKGRWRAAAYTAQICCRLCFGYRCVWIHSARLELENDEAYTPFLPNILPTIISESHSFPSDDSTGLGLKEGLDDLDIFDEQISDQGDEPIRWSDNDTSGEENEDPTDPNGEESIDDESCPVSLPLVGDSRASEAHPHRYSEENGPC